LSDGKDAEMALIPAPWDDPFAKFDAFLAEAAEALDLARKGIELLSRWPAAFKPAALRQVERGKETLEEATRRVQQVDQAAAEAKSLIQNDFAILRAHLMVGLWGALEALVFNVVVCWLVNQPEILRDDKLLKVRVPLGLLDEPNRELRMTHVAEELVQQLRIGQMSGVSRFETLLEVVRLAGAVPDELRKALFETAQVRNLIVHRTSWVDRKFRDACPWLETKIGTRFDLTADRYHSYCNAMAGYASLIYGRARVAISSDSNALFGQREQ
jgi:hypothetical protein